MINLEELGYFLFMEEQERKQKESSEEEDSAEDEDKRDCFKVCVNS